MHPIQNRRHIRKLLYPMLFLSMLMSLTLANPALDQSHLDPFVFISTSDGKDAILIREGGKNQTVFQCNNESEMILTPGINIDKKSISFVVENGTGVRAVHLLILNQSSGTEWTFQDTILASVKGGAWPTNDLAGNMYLSMKDPRSVDYSTATDIYQLNGLQLTRLSTNSGEDRHLWPLLAPEGDKLHFRVFQGSTDVNTPKVKQSIIYVFESHSRALHLVGQNVFVEQWPSTDKLLYSHRLEADSRIRVYYLYDINSHKSTELYRGMSWQAQLSSDGRYFATLQNFPQGSAQFDVFITDLNSGETLNMTNSPLQSESLIGWLK